MLSIDPNTPKLCALRHVDISIGQDLHRRTNTIRFLDAEGLPQGPGFHVWHLDARFLQCRCLPEFMWKVTEDYEHQKKNIYRVLEPSPWTVPTNLRCPAKTKNTLLLIPQQHTTYWHSGPSQLLQSLQDPPDMSDIDMCSTVFFIFNDCTIQQWLCASSAAESAGFTAYGIVNGWTWQPKIRGHNNDMPCLASALGLGLRCLPA